MSGEHLEKRIATRRQALLDTYRETANLMVSCKAAGVTDRTHRRWLKDEQYRADFAQAYEDFRDMVRREAVIRGIVGWDEPVFGRNGIIGTKRVKSERIFRDLMQAHCPEFREKQPSPIGTQNNVQINITVDELEDTERKLGLSPSQWKLPETK